MNNCDQYTILKTGNVIPGTQFRGEMQTFLIQIQKGTTAKDIMQSWEKTNPQRNPNRRLTLEERVRQRAEAAAAANQQQLPSNPSNQQENDGSGEGSVQNGRGITFLWTLQRERRPPRQDCWLVHEVLFTENAGMLTT